MQNNELIEILPGLFYDPSKAWYEQPQELIDLALAVEKTQPIDYEIETFANHTRYKKATWHHTTELGVFEMVVEMVYLYNVEHNAFNSKYEHNKITITKIQNA